MYSDISNCSCISTRDRAQSLYLVDCSSIMRWSIPRTVPVYTTHLSLEYAYSSSKGNAALEANSFAKLSKLIYLDLRHMALFRIRSGAFNGLRSLKVLLLGYNYLHLADSLVDDVFSPVAQSLQYLDLLIDYTTLPTSRYLTNLTNLQSIVVSYTGLDTFGVEFQSMNNLREIIIRKSDAAAIEDNAFKYLQGLDIKCVNMSGSGLTLVTKAFAKLPNLETLDLSQNPSLFIVYPQIFQQFMESVNNSKLKFLNVENTGMVDIEGHEIGTLEHINVRYNRLQDIPPGLSSVKSFLAAHNNYLVGKALPQLLTYSHIEDIDLGYQKAPSENNELFSGETQIISCKTDKRRRCRVPLPPNLNSIRITHNSANLIGFTKVGQIILTTNSSLKIVDMSFTQTTNLSHPVLCDPGVVISIEKVDLSGE